MYMQISHLQRSVGDRYANKGLSGIPRFKTTEHLAGVSPRKIEYSAVLSAPTLKHSAHYSDGQSSPLNYKHSLQLQKTPDFSIFRLPKSAL
jgi:hypothetical protein